MTLDSDQNQDQDQPRTGGSPCGSRAWISRFRQDLLHSLQHIHPHEQNKTQRDGADIGWRFPTPFPPPPLSLVRSAQMGSHMSRVALASQKHPSPVDMEKITGPESRMCIPNWASFLFEKISVFVARSRAFRSPGCKCATRTCSVPPCAYVSVSLLIIDAQ